MLKICVTQCDRVALVPGFLRVLDDSGDLWLRGILFLKPSSRKKKNTIINTRGFDVVIIQHKTVKSR